MNKQILLIEPNYKNKYPPLGLMKISTYHKLKKDNVVFFKGCSDELKNQRWDRIYITTLFSFHWKKTIETIQFYKRSVIKTKDFLIGGILATTMYNELFLETGIKPLKGLLDKPGMLGKDNYIVDRLAPDYDILDQIDYKYPTNDAYIGYMTRGCCNHCDFCAVPKLEPIYNPYISMKENKTIIDLNYGEKRDLLLMDNNVLASKCFDKIIDEIIGMGFQKGAKFVSPNLFKVYFERLLNTKNEVITINKIIEILVTFPEERIKSKKVKDEFISLVQRYGLLDNSKNEYESQYLSKLKNGFEQINVYFEKYRNKAKKSRYIDFNQGIDARLLTDYKMKRLSELNIRPLRIAFDDINLTEIYSSKIRLAAKYGIRILSNYVLYNYLDTPKDLYERLKINIDLNESEDICIFSFPMKYIPITEKDRTYIGEHWSRKYLRTVQTILNVAHGAVMPKRDFFEKAFGKTFQEFEELLLMPEDYVYYRFYAEAIGKTQEWRSNMNDLKEDIGLFKNTLKIIKQNNFNNLDLNLLHPKERNVLEHYKNRIKLKSFKEWQNSNKSTMFKELTPL